MPTENLDPERKSTKDDWEGNNAAFSCRACGSVFIVSAQLHRKGRQCPECCKSTGHVTGGKLKNGHAWIEW